MAHTESGRTDEGPSVYESYVEGVRILEVDDEGGTVYRFEAPNHPGMEFEAAWKATLYADLYFDTNGFREVWTTYDDVNGDGRLDYDDVVTLAERA